MWLRSALVVVALGLASAMGLAVLPGGIEKSSPMWLSIPQTIVGGWNLETPALVDSAVRDGVNLAFLYGAPPVPSSELGGALRRSHLRVISAEISEVLSRYECSRIFTVAPRPRGLGLAEYCTDDPHYSKDDLMEDVRAVVARDAGNQLVSGYWVLDDVPSWDVGGLHDVVEEIRKALPPELPTFCGFAADLEANGTYVWSTGVAANFSPDGCNFVAPYVYRDSRDRSAPGLTGVDWSMVNLLMDVRKSLVAYGWNPDVQPMIGVGQAWGGEEISRGVVTDPPTASEMVVQASGFRNAGAIGIAWFAWTSDRYRKVRTPANDEGLSAGVRGGGAVFTQHGST